MKKQLSSRVKPDSIVSVLLGALDQGYKKKAWHGTNLRGSLRGLSASQAAWRPSPQRHSIWEVAIHAAYWKYAVWRRLTGVKRGSFPIEGSNWFHIAEGSGETEWKRHLKLLDDYHNKLRSAVEQLNPKSFGSRWPKIEYLVAGIGLHDVYHTGQIQILKRLLKEMS